MTFHSKRKTIHRDLKCPFCPPGKMGSYKEASKLLEYISDRGKIVNRSRSGVCARHQRRLAREIKRARHLGLLPFVNKI